MTATVALVLALAAQKPVLVASKPFAESYLLAEMFAQVLEDSGFPVDRRPGLGATEIAFGALRTGAIDVYPEYTGTGLLAILHEDAIPTPRDLPAGRLGVRAAMDVHWLAPLGFENTFAIAVRAETAQRHGLRTLSDLGRASPSSWLA
jgi:glycine betaine/choline ABC-type transport system substrate-binding protein